MMEFLDEQALLAAGLLALRDFSRNAISVITIPASSVKLTISSLVHRRGLEWIAQSEPST